MNEQKPLQTYRKIIKPFLVIMNRRIILRRNIKHLHILIKARRNYRCKLSAKLPKEKSIRSKINGLMQHIDQ